MNKAGALLLAIAIVGGVLLSLFLERGLPEISPNSGAGDQTAQPPPSPPADEPSGPEVPCTDPECGPSGPETGDGSGSSGGDSGLPDGAGGPASGAAPGNQTNETNETNQTPLACTYSYSETIGSGSATYINTGCSNPLPTCDPSGSCVPCSSSTGCVQIKISSFVTGTESQESTVHFYTGTGTAFEGTHNSLAESCTIKQGSNTVFSQQLPEEQCFQQFTSYLACTGGLCG